MNRLILVAAISFGIGSITGGLTVYLQEGPRPLNAFEQMMVDQQKQIEQQNKDVKKALRSSPAFPGGMGKSMMGYSGPPEQSSGAKKK